MAGAKKLRAMAVTISLMALVVLAGAGAYAYSGATETAEIPRRIDAGALDLEYMPGQVIVKYNDQLSIEQVAEINASPGVELVLQEIGPRDGGRVELLSLKPGVSVEDAVEYLSSFPQVEYAEPNYVMRAAYTPPDPGFTNQWGLNNTGQTIKGVPGTPDADIDAPEAWNLERGQSNPVKVAVIDSGIDLNHPDLYNKIWSNVDEIPGNGVDDDGNGYIDDAHGYNFAGISHLAYTSGGWALGYNASTQNLAQSIKGTGCSLTHVGIGLQKIGIPTQNITVSVRSNLNGPDLASYIIYPEEAPASPDIVYKQLSSTVLLSSGTTYYLVFTTLQNSTSNYYILFDRYGTWNGLSDTYVEGNEYYNAGSWTPETDRDFFFITNGNNTSHDDNGHGTHCGGIVGAESNGIGVAGASPGATLMPLKAGDSSGSLLTSDTVAAIYYAADNGADIISMSFGGPSYSSTQADAINYAYQEGVTLFAAAMNSGDSTMYYPANYNHVIGVGATDNQDVVASFSTYNASVDVSAPGVNVYSTMPTYPVTLNTFISTPLAQNYDFMSGTSMACPMAAGLGALVISRNPSYSPDQVEQVIKTQANDLGVPGRDDYYGYGRINALNTLNAVPALPNASTWYLAEGSTDGGMETYVLVQNPNANPVTVNLTLMTDSGPQNPGDLQNQAIAGNSRRTFPLHSFVKSYNVSTKIEAQGGANIICERAMYGGNRTWAHDSIGTTSAAPTWYLAEGSTDGGMETYVLVQNPNANPVTVNLTLMTDSGPQNPGDLQNQAIAGNSRRTFPLHNYVKSYNVSTKVESQGGNVICERAMYGGNRTWAHDSIGYSE